MKKPLASNMRRSNSHKIWQNLDELEHSYMKEEVFSSSHKPPNMLNAMLITVFEH